MSEAWITHIGHALPGPPLPQEAVVDWMLPRLAAGSDPARLRRIAERSGVRHRHSVLDLLGDEGEALYPRDGRRPRHEELSALFAARALPLALAAVADACPDGVGAVTHLVVATCTGAVAPGLDVQLARALGLPRARRSVVGFMGCYAAIPALRIAADACRADPGARVLLVCCELSSLHFEPGPRDDALVAACLFGDGAAAAVISAAGDGAGSGLLRVGADASILVPDAEEAMSWSAGAHGFALRLSPYVAQALSADLEPLRDALLDPADAAGCRWIVHPGGPRIIDAVERRLGLGDGALDASRAALAAAGNRSSATVLAILADLLRDDGSDSYALLAFGPGLSIEGLLLGRQAAPLPAPTSAARAEAAR